MPQLNVKSDGPRCIAPMSDYSTIVILDHDAVIIRYLYPAERISKAQAAYLILADYPVTARPGCNPRTATAAGTINR
jgi:hypothetical protein